MNTNILETTSKFSPISRHLSCIKVLWDVRVDKETETCTYVKMGEEKTISGEKYWRLDELIRLNKYNEPNNRMAMSFRDPKTGKNIIIIDRAFYKEF
jgi:hypothetical protein